MRTVIILICLLLPGLFAGQAAAQEFALRSGDLIFQQSARSEVENSIQSVTNSIEGYDFTHVGIVYIDPSGEVFVLEAAPPEVTLTPLEEYLHPSQDEPDGVDGEYPGWPVSVAARLKPKHRHLIPDALAEGMLLVGRPYDYVYDIADDSYYCSELIYEIFRRAGGGQEVFHLKPMTFKSPETGATTAGWVEYFERLGVSIPEGEPGINPGAMSLSEAVDIIDCGIGN